MVLSHELLNLMADLLLALSHGLWHVVVKLRVSGCRFLQRLIEIVFLLLHITIWYVLHAGVQVKWFRIL